MGDTNVQTTGGPGAGHHQLHHHQLHHPSTAPPQHPHHDPLSFGLGFFPDPDINSKSLPPFSSFGESEGIGEGLSGRLLDLGGANGGPPPWDLYGEGLSARLIDVGAPTPLGLGIGVGVGLGLGFAPPPPSAVPARDQPPPAQYRPWESKNHPDSNGNPPTLLELGRMMTVTPPPGTPNSSNSNPAFNEVQLFQPQQHVNSSPKLPSFQSQFQHTYSSPSPHPPQQIAPPEAFVPQQQNRPYPVVPIIPAVVHPRPEFVHHERPHFNGGYPLPAEQQQQQQYNGPQQQRHPVPVLVPITKVEIEDSRFPIRPDGRKKEKRKYRASSLESSSSDASDAQVPSISSTANTMRGFKHPLPQNGGSDSDAVGEKQSKKKRKRCGECIGCMRKDNCANCAPCRNDKSHQICKMRRCEKLTEKKIKVPREKGEGRAARNANNNSNGSNSSTTSTNSTNGNTSQQPSSTANPPTPTSTPNNWDRGYTPNAGWASNGQPATEDGNQWNTQTYQPENYDPNFNFNPPSFHPPAPVTADFAGARNGFQPRPSPQPQQIQIGGFSPHMTSPHPSPGSGQMNGRCGSVPPHYADSTNNTNGYINGFTSPSPRPPSSSNPPTEGFRNGDSAPTSNGMNGPYPSPQQQLTNGYQSKSESWDGDKRSTPHEELNNRLKEKILNKQQMQHSSFQHEMPTNGQYYMNYNGNPPSFTNGEDFGDQNGTFSTSPSAKNNVRLDVHLEPNSGHFLGPSHPQNGNSVDQTSPAISSPPRKKICLQHDDSQTNLKDEMPPCQCFPPDQCKSPVR